MGKIIFLFLIAFAFDTCYSFDNIGKIDTVGGVSKKYRISSQEKEFIPERMYKTQDSFVYERSENEITGCVPQIVCNTPWVVTNNNYKVEGTSNIYNLWVNASTLVRYGGEEDICGAIPYIADSIYTKVGVFPENQRLLYESEKTVYNTSELILTSGKKTHFGVPAPCGIRSSHRVTINGESLSYSLKNGCIGYPHGVSDSEVLLYGAE
ncbi:hypothetical protein EP073_06640 [Geovibrio thiophilus]|uniref:Uncharacterized protein n=1 Tax=Geovibrio thiophilus TaxID=139438 RepID=A0A410JYF7_9BACT|nr:hypothetical protein [Geovibrio thiophilus]QAR33091.1 hypothetical protein EP073_06640 [Geovibrio thiophilus]